jgi:hypothetical protein
MMKLVMVIHHFVAMIMIWLWLDQVELELHRDFFIIYDLQFIQMQHFSTHFSLVTDLNQDKFGIEAQVIGEIPLETSGTD